MSESIYSDLMNKKYKNINRNGIVKQAYKMDQTEGILNKYRQRDDLKINNGNRRIEGYSNDKMRKKEQHDDNKLNPKYVDSNWNENSLSNPQLLPYKRLINNSFISPSQYSGYFNTKPYGNIPINNNKQMSHMQYQKNQTAKQSNQRTTGYRERAYYY